MKQYRAVPASRGDARWTTTAAGETSSWRDSTVVSPAPAAVWYFIFQLCLFHRLWLAPFETVRCVSASCATWMWCFKHWAHTSDHYYLPAGACSVHREASRRTRVISSWLSAVSADNNRRAWSDSYIVDVMTSIDYRKVGQDIDDNAVDTTRYF